MYFDWDEEKSASNLRKHGVHLSLGEAVFQDEYALERVDHVSDPEEVRWERLGLIYGREFVVIYTVRGEAIRLISVRKAVRHEREQYWQDRTTLGRP